MTHHYVRIEAASSQGSTSSGSTAPLVPKRRRIGVTLACDACRRKKIRCGGSKPSCSSCLKAGIVCNYFEPGLIESENARDASILQMLRNLPSAEAGRLFEIIHTNKQGDSLTTCPSLATVLWSYVSPSRNKLELELMVRHPISYPPLVPLEAASLSFDSVLRPSRIFVTQQETGSVSQKYSPPYTSSLCHFSNEVRVRYFPPTPPSNDILLDLKIQQWTNVRIDNELAASILSHYIETDYQVLPMFDLDLFVENLILNKPYFCSKFLVSSLFSWICQSYSTILPEASDLGKDFFVEAQTLIPDGPQLVTLTAVSALQFLSLAAISSGHDRLGLEYLQKGVTIGTNMGLFNRHYGHGAASTWLGNEQDWRRSASYTAWGVYNRVSLHNLRYRLNEIGEPPRIAMPGTNGIGPSTENAIPEEASLHTQVFKASCELWVLSYYIHQARQRSHSAHSDFVAEAQAMFLRLLSWAGSLPVALVRHDQTNHAVAMMHIYFHVIIVDMFREVSHRSDEPFVMSSFDTRCIYPRAVYAASINQLKRLLLAFRISFPMAHYSILSQIVLIYVGNAVLLQEEGKEQSECQFYLRVCFAGLEDLYGSYRQVWGVMKGLLSMSLKRDAINPDEAERIMREMMILGQHHDNSEETTSSAIMDLELAVIDPSAAQVNCLAAQFDDLMLTVKAKV